jgi:hypothetical protein
LLSLLSADAADDAAACEAALLAAGGKRGAQLAPQLATGATTVADALAASDGAPAWLAEALQFASMGREKQAAQLERWEERAAEALAAAAGAPTTKPPPPPPPQLRADAAGHLRAAAELRRASQLDDVIARVLEDDDWQALMRARHVAAAVAAVQADPAAISAWHAQPDCLAALETLRRLQAFCKPRGFKTSLPALLAGPANSAADAIARAAAHRKAADRALDAARAAILDAAAGKVEAVALERTLSAAAMQPALPAAAVEDNADDADGHPVLRAFLLRLVAQLLFAVCSGMVIWLTAWLWETIMTRRSRGGDISVPTREFDGEDEF